MILRILLHQGIGLEAFNALPHRRAVHALFECCNCVILAGELATERPYTDRNSLFRRTDALLFELPEPAVDQILEAQPRIGTRPGSTRSHCEPCALVDDDPQLMAQVRTAARGYATNFGFEFLCYVDGQSAAVIGAAIADRMHHDLETERKVLRNELAKIIRSRMERMLGPEGGYSNWW